MKIKLAILLIAGSLVGPAWGDLPAGPRNQHVLRFGVLPVNQPDTMKTGFQPLISYLQKATGYQIELVTYPSSGQSGGYTAAVRGLIAGDTSFA